MIELGADLDPPAGFDAPVAAGQQVLVAAEPTGAGGRAVGAVVARFEGGVARLPHVWIAPGAGPVEDDLVDAVRRHFGARGAAVISMEVNADQPELARSVHGAPVLGMTMTKPVAAFPPGPPAGFGHRPMRDDEYARWTDEQVAGYAEDSLARSGGDRARADREARESFAALLPDGTATADTSLLVLTDDDARVGFLWLRHHWTQHGDTTFVFDVAVDPGHRGRGLGRAAMAAGEHRALAVGDTTYALHVFGFNDVARRLYRSYGFTARSQSFDVARLP